MKKKSNSNPLGLWLILGFDAFMKKKKIPNLSYHSQIS